MHTSRRGFLRGLVATVAASALPTTTRRASAMSAAAPLPMAPVQAPVVRPVQGGEWVQVGPAIPVARLFAPAGGALFARTAYDLLRSDDAGETWATVLENTGGGSMTGSTAPNVTIDGLAYNPLAPANLYVAQNTRVTSNDPNPAATIQASGDGGATWAPLGQPLPQTTGLALGVDGAYLFAATKGGVMRMAQGA